MRPLSRLVARAVRRSAGLNGTVQLSARPISASAPSVLSRGRRTAEFGSQRTVSFSSDSRKSSKSRPSFAIAAAFEGHEDLDEDEEKLDRRSRRSPRRPQHDDDDQTDERADALSKQFRIGMDRKKQWMQELAEQNQYAALVQVVADCYAPLYAKYSDDLGTAECPLTATFKWSAEMEAKFQPQQFDDTLTKFTEQEAMALLMMAQQSAMVSAILEHRLELTDHLNQLALTVHGDTVLDDERLALSSPLRSFFSWGISAYSHDNNHERVFTLYNRALSAKVYPTANMNVAFLTSLVELRKLDDAFAFYEIVTKESRPVSVFFYRRLLHAIAMARDGPLAVRVVQDMKVKGFKLREMEYLHAIRAFDEDYYLTVSKSAGQKEGQLITPMDRYTTCREREEEREDHPEAFKEQEEASREVLELFDDMVENDRIEPTLDEIYPRVITAAVFLEAYDKAVEILELHENHADKPLHYAGVRMGVNALLMLDRPEEAWELVKKAHPKIEPRQYTHFANIMDYACIHNRVDVILRLLQEVKDLKLQAVLTNTVTKGIISTLCRNVNEVEDDLLWDTVTRKKSGFEVLSNPFWLGYFVEHCGRHDRSALVLRAIKKRDRKRIASLKVRLGLHLMKDFEKRGDLHGVADIFSATDKKELKKDKFERDVIEVIARVYEKLGLHDEARELQHKHRISDKE